MSDQPKKSNFFEKLATFIVDKRNLIFFLYAIAIIASLITQSWVKVCDDLTQYLPETTETRRGLTLMEDEMKTYGTARIIVSHVTYEIARDLADQIEDLNNISSVDFWDADKSADDTTLPSAANKTYEDYMQGADALITVTFRGENDDQSAKDGLAAVKELLAPYDTYISTDVGYSKSETLNEEMGIILVVAALVIVLVLLLVMLIGACVGLINGFVMAKFKVHPYIITLAMQMIVYGIYLTVSNSVQVGSFDSSYTTSFVTKPLFQIQTGVRPNGTAIFTVVPMYVLLALIVTALMWVVWNKTAFGKNMFAVGSNEEAARVSGVNVMMTIIGVFMVAGALYGYTGFIEAARMGSSTATLGLNYEADAISAAVIGGVSFVGGTGRISGVVLGVFMMQLIIAGMTFLGISGNVTYIVKGAVILFAVILDMRKYMTRK